MKIFEIPKDVIRKIREKFNPQNPVPAPKPVKPKQDKE